MIVPICPNCEKVHYKGKHYFDLDHRTKKFCVVCNTAVIEVDIDIDRLKEENK